MSSVIYLNNKKNSFTNEMIKKLFVRLDMSNKKIVFLNSEGAIFEVNDFSDLSSTNLDELEISFLNDLAESLRIKSSMNIEFENFEFKLHRKAVIINNKLITEVLFHNINIDELENFFIDIILENGNFCYEVSYIDKKIISKIKIDLNFDFEVKKVQVFERKKRS